MKIVNIIGGLGNQMFEYALYLALKNAHPNENIFCSINSFNGYKLHNGYELERIFGIKLKTLERYNNGNWNNREYC